MLKKLYSLTGMLAILLALLCGISASAQNKTVRGKVVDADGGPVIGRTSRWSATIPWAQLPT